MERSRSFTLTLALALLPWSHVAAQTAGGVVVSEVLADPATGGREFVELWNTGNASVSLEGWKLKDAGTNAYTFGPMDLGPGERVVVWSGGVQQPGEHAFPSSTVWNNAGDGATLLDASGAVVAWFGYGTGQVPPAGFDDTGLGAAAKGKSWTLGETGWSQSDPTPGTAALEQSSLVVEVADVAPRITWDSVAGAVKPSATVELEFTVEEDNGDPVAWEVRDGSAVMAAGSGAGTHTAAVTAPSTERAWTVSLHASDGTGHAAQADLGFQVRASMLDVVVPAGGLPLPPLAPGATAQSSAEVGLHNAGLEPLAPVFDASDFTGPAGSFPAEGHLRLRWTSDAGVVEVPYTGPLTPLPPMPAGATWNVALVVELPVPLAAGTYGTSFSVVA